MTAYVDFQPSTESPFQFQATFDGSSYTVYVTWNIYRRNYYINIYDNSGTLIVCKAMVGSPTNYDINLIWGYFVTSTLVFRVANQQFEIGP